MMLERFFLPQSDVLICNFDLLPHGRHQYIPELSSCELSSIIFEHDVPTPPSLHCHSMALHRRQSARALDRLVSGYSVRARRKNR